MTTVIVAPASAAARAVEITQQSVETPASTRCGVAPVTSTRPEPHLPKVGADTTAAAESARSDSSSTTSNNGSSDGTAANGHARRYAAQLPSGAVGATHRVTTVREPARSARRRTGSTIVGTSAIPTGSTGRRRCAADRSRPARRRGACGPACQRRTDISGCRSPDRQPLMDVPKVLLHLGTQDRAQPDGQRDPQPHQRGDAELLPVLRRQRALEEPGDGEVDVDPRLQVAEPLLEGGELAEQRPAGPASRRSRPRSRQPSCGRARRA